MKRVWSVVGWILMAAAACVAVAYIGDDFSVHRRMARRTKTDPLETTQVRTLYAVPRKDGKAELDFGDPETQTCVHSLFPHLGYDPCWYTKRQNQQPTVILALP